jgi:hypothetical protein
VVDQQDLVDLEDQEAQECLVVGQDKQMCHSNQYHLWVM